MIALLFALLTAAPQQTSPAATAPASHEETQLERDTRQLASELRCPVCQGLSLQDSPAELSQEMRHIITEQLQAGKSVPEVRAYFVEKYGEWILLQPEPKGFNLSVYIVPVLVLLGGATFVYLQARKWTRNAEARGDIVEEEDPIEV